MKQSILVLLALAIYACSPSKKTAEETTNEETAEEPKLTLTKAPASPEFPNASLKKMDVSIEKGDSLYNVIYSFEVNEYELGAQTSDAETRGIANSGKGQHIHYIVNNGPYAAHYMPGVSSELAEGNYVVLAFLSRSYHESLKTPGAFHIENLVVGDVDDPEEVDLTTPHLFYSRPKGTYKGADTQKVMLDFYLLNTEISEGGNKVKATINGEVFMISEWAPFFIEGMPMGENTIKLELLDKDGQLINGPYNSVERTITLAE